MQSTEAARPARVQPKRETRPLSERFLRGAFWTVAGSVLGQGLTLVISVLAARLLGRETFGQFGMLQSTIGVFAIFAELGFGVTVTRQVAALRSSNPERAGRQLALALLTSIAMGCSITGILIASSRWIAGSVLLDPGIGVSVCVAAGMPLFNGVAGVIIGGLNGLEHYRAAAWITCQRGLLGLLLAIPLIHTFGLPGAVAALVFGMAASSVSGFLVLRKVMAEHGLPLSAKPDWTEVPSLFSFSFPTFCSLAMVAPVVWLANLILVRQPDGYALTALMAVGSNWRTLIAFVPNRLTQAALPLLSSLRKDAEDDSYRRLLGWNLAITGILATLIALPVCAFPDLILSVYGREFTEGRTVLVLSAATAVLLAVNAVIGCAMISQGQVWRSLLFNTLWAATLIAAAWVLVPRMQATGMALAYLISYGVHTVWCGAYIRGTLTASRVSEPETVEAAL